MLDDSDYRMYLSYVGQLSLSVCDIHHRCWMTGVVRRMKVVHRVSGVILGVRLL